MPALCRCLLVFLTARLRRELVLHASGSPDLKPLGVGRWHWPWLLCIQIGPRALLTVPSIVLSPVIQSFRSSLLYAPPRITSSFLRVCSLWDALQHSVHHSPAGFLHRHPCLHLFRIALHHYAPGRKPRGLDAVTFSGEASYPNLDYHHLWYTLGKAAE